MGSFSQVGAWILMSLGTSGILFFVSLSRFRRALPARSGTRGWWPVAGESNLGLGVLVAGGSGLLAVLLLGGLFLAFRGFWLLRNPLFGPLVEELGKILVLGLVLAPRMERGMSEVSSARVRTFAIGTMGLYGLAMGIGFGLGEAILSSLDSPNTLLLRGVTSIILHGITGALGSRFISTRSLGKACWKCPVVAVLLHGGYNYLVGLIFPFSYLVFFLLLFFAVQLLRMFNFQDDSQRASL